MNNQDELENYQRAAAEFEDRARRELLDVFHRLGVLRTEGERHDRLALRDRLGVVADYHRLFDVLLEVLERGGYLRRDGGTVVATAAVTGRLTEAPERHPQLRPVADLLRRCLDAYADVLTGRCSHLEVLFPNGSTDLVVGAYRGTEVTDRYNDLVAAAVRRVVERHRGDRPVRVLEVGAGTGGTSAPVLAALRPLADRVRYTYTDVSSGFVRHGRKRFGDDHPFAEFEVLDVEAPLAEQGFPLGGYDIVLGTNVLHATRRIGHTLDQVKRLLRTGGLLLVSEGTRVADHLSLVFGLTTGWWLFEDAELRIPGSPLLNAEAWADALACAGFRDVAVHGLPPTAEGPTHQSLVTGVSDGLVTEQPEATAPAPVEPVAPTTSSGQAERYVISVLARVLELSEDQLDPATTFDNYGVDSLVVLELSKAFERDLGPLPKTLLFEQDSAVRLAAFLAAEHGPALARLLAPVAVATPDPVDTNGEEPASLAELVNGLADDQVDDLLATLLSSQNPARGAREADRW